MGNPKDEILRALRFTHNPAEFKVYKPRPSGDGVALKLNLRLTPIYTKDESNREYIASVDGGLFVDLARQDGKNEAGFPTFAWKADTLVTAKLCMPDILAILTAIRSVRIQRKPVPTSLRPKARAESSDADRKTAAATVSLFHKTETSTAAIKYQFDSDGATFSISKSREHRASIKLTLMEEYALERYLLKALDGYLETGY